MYYNNEEFGLQELEATWKAISNVYPYYVDDEMEFKDYLERIDFYMKIDELTFHTCKKFGEVVWCWNVDTDKNSAVVVSSLEELTDEEIEKYLI